MHWWEDHPLINMLNRNHKFDQSQEIIQTFKFQTTFLREDQQEWVVTTPSTTFVKEWTAGSLKEAWVTQENVKTVSVATKWKFVWKISATDAGKLKRESKT